MGEEFGIADHAIKLIAMNDKKAAPIGGGMFCLSGELYARDFQPKPIPKKLVVITWDIDNLSAMARHAQDQANDLIVIGIPIPGPA